MKSILDDSFRYTRSIDTDLRKTFASGNRPTSKGAGRQRESEEGIPVKRAQTRYGVVIVKVDTFEATILVVGVHGDGVSPSDRIGGSFSSSHERWTVALHR